MDGPPKNILVVTGHSVDVGPIASALFIAEQWSRQGHAVTVLSIDTKNSAVGRLRRFFATMGRAVPGRYRDSYIGLRWTPIAIPPNALRRAPRALSKACIGVFESVLNNAIRSIRGEIDVICIESGFGVMGYKVLRRRWPAAKMLYMANDLLETLGFDAEILRLESDSFRTFDLIRCPAKTIADEIRSKSPGNVLLLRHGIDKERFDNCRRSPYDRDRNAISVGAMLFDGVQIETLASMFPDWLFHVFGPSGTSECANVVYHGFRPFPDIIPYLKFADVGLLPYGFRKSAEYLVESSLKAAQYQYVGLPTCGPQFAVGAASAFGYQAGDRESMRRAFAAAAKAGRGPGGCAEIMSWSDVADKLITELHAA